MLEPDEFAEDRGMQRLNRAERLMLTAVRRLVMGLGLCAGVTRELSVLCGPQTTEILVGIRSFLCALDRSARHKLTVAPPGWFGPTADEWRMLALVSAAQNRDEYRLETLVCWFSRRDLQPLLLQASYTLADALASRNLRISNGHVGPTHATSATSSPRLSEAVPAAVTGP